MFEERRLRFYKPFGQVVDRTFYIGDDGESPPPVDMLEAVFEEVKPIGKVVKADLPEVKPQI